MPSKQITTGRRIKSLKQLMSISYCNVPGSGKMAANLLIHIPHASLYLPRDFWRDVTVDRKIIKKNLHFMADYKVDELARDVDCHKGLGTKPPRRL